MFHCIQKIQGSLGKVIELNKVLSKLETLNSKKKIPEKHGLEVPKSSLSSGREEIETYWRDKEKGKIF